MSRFAHFNPDDPEGAMERLIDRADDARKAARENMTRVQPGWYAEWLLMKYGRELIALPRPIMCNWCGKPHIQPAQNALEALRGCCKPARAP